VLLAARDATAQVRPRSGGIMAPVWRGSRAPNFFWKPMIALMRLAVGRFCARLPINDQRKSQ
jgi:hypothetical protein